ncbi:putative G-protein coupled receptor egl-47 [Caenorhabditis elegans]|uniref:Probable G-protein coupled receptor egl-47 n=1 Tax=Caenorhabditis elegans TaxID=6239 RepID=EGL47_CAEEL|nr:G protein-coupled receptor [Caenorhabditis elegans]AAS21318.1 egg laying defective EGL-47A [Caenorhabditis elegans]CAH04730.1 G protein-coupled receptor [Caenorhabditis elegans]|eukprot:NP_001023728.1 Uncharacterized protein CELE_C50H2.2 [Caenorhabditis elegans]
MYPFNRTTSIHAESASQHIDELDDDDFGRSNGKFYSNRHSQMDSDVVAHQVPPGSPVEKTILASILEMSTINDMWVKTFTAPGANKKDKKRRESLFECSWRGVHCVSNSLRSILFLFRLLAIFPATTDRKSRRKRNHRSIIKLILYVNYIVLAVLLNSFLIKMNFKVLMLYKHKFGLMHTGTVASMITATKPVINVFVIVLSAIKFKSHQRLLKTIDMVDVCFRSAFGVSPPLRIYKFVFFFTLLIIFFSALILKVVEFVGTGEIFGEHILTDCSFILVPVLSLWNIIPLLYYHLYNILVRFYCRTLIKSMNREHKKRHFSLKFYYEQFTRITNVQEAVGDVFNPLLLFSLAWSLLVLCLTLYFLSEPTSTLLVPITPEQVTNPKIREKLNITVHVKICWAAYQVVMAILHIIIICSTGMMTNETTRQIVNAVLRIVPDANADLDRFQISCFVHKMTTQFMWGMTVWRAFPLERTTFFTLISVIVTYSLLLFRFKDDMVQNPPYMAAMAVFNTSAVPTPAPG